MHQNSDWNSHSVMQNAVKHFFSYSQREYLRPVHPLCLERQTFQVLLSNPYACSVGDRHSIECSRAWAELFISVVRFVQQSEQIGSLQWAADKQRGLSRQNLMLFLMGTGAEHNKCLSRRREPPLTMK